MIKVVPMIVYDRVTAEVLLEQPVDYLMVFHKIPEKEKVALELCLIAAKEIAL